MIWALFRHVQLPLIVTWDDTFAAKIIFGHPRLGSPPGVGSARNETAVVVNNGEKK